MDIEKIARECGIEDYETGRWAAHAFGIAELHAFAAAIRRETLDEAMATCIRSDALDGVRAIRQLIDALPPRLKTDEDFLSVQVHSDGRIVGQPPK